jgi:16S rRNA (cytidine1402-2'-O)-methyltransferase
VIYEAPHRVLECVHDLLAALGGERQLVIARELTKLFESVHVVSLAEAESWLLADANRQRGEFVLIVAPAAEPARGTAIEADKLLRELLRELPPSRAASVAAKLCDQPRRALYERALELAPGEK